MIANMLGDLCTGHSQGGKGCIYIHHQILPHNPDGSCSVHRCARQHSTPSARVAGRLADIFRRGIVCVCVCVFVCEILRATALLWSLGPSLLRSLVHMRVNVRVYIYIYVCINIYIYIYIPSLSRTHAYTCTCIHVRVYMYVYTCTCIP